MSNYIIFEKPETFLDSDYAVDYLEQLGHSKETADQIIDRLQFPSGDQFVRFSKESLSGITPEMVTFLTTSDDGMSINDWDNLETSLSRVEDELGRSFSATHLLHVTDQLDLNTAKVFEQLDTYGYAISNDPSFKLLTDDQQAAMMSLYHKMEVPIEDTIANLQPVTSKNLQDSLDDLASFLQEQKTL